MRSLLPAKLRVSLFVIIVIPMVCSCASNRVPTVKYKPFPNETKEDSGIKFINTGNSISFEIRSAPITGPVENLAIHYQSMFPGGEIIRPGDIEEYLKVSDRNAYKVTFRPTYIRRRKRVTDESAAPEGWKSTKIEDPTTGKPVDIMYGPIIPRQKILYLVEGEKFVYYILMTADGDEIQIGRNKLEEFIRDGIDYK